MQKLNMTSKQRKMAIGVSSVIGVLVLLLGVIVLTGDDADEQIVADDVAVEREVERSPVSTTPKSTTTKPEPKATTSTTVPEPEEVPETTEAPPTTEKPVETTQPTPPPAPPTTQAPPPPAPPVTQAPPPPPPPPAPPTTQAPPPPPPPPAQGVVRRPDLEGPILNRINQERANAGRSTVARSTCLGDQVSAPWAKHLATTQSLSHNPNWVAQTRQRCESSFSPPLAAPSGEIAGHGPCGFDIVAGWMSSPPHRQNMLNYTQTHAGIAVYENGGHCYYIVNFATTE